MLQVRLLGQPRVETSDGETREIPGRQSWAVLARLLLADRPVARRELSAELFPDTVDPLGSLRWCLASLRRALGSADLFTGDPIQQDLPPEITVDVLTLDSGTFDLASTGELLEGIEPRSGPEFSTWLLVARQQVGARVAALLREETIVALSRGQHERSVSLAELAVRRSPYDEGAHVLLVKSLALAGDADAALAHVAAVEDLFRRELGCDPSPALRSAARGRVAVPGVNAAAIASTLLDSGRAALSAGAIDAGLDCLRQAGAQAESAGDDALWGQCLLELGSGLVHALQGFDDEGSVLLEQAVRLATATGDRATAVSAHRERGYAEALAGRRPEADRHLAAGEELAGDDSQLLAGLHAVAGFNLADWGRFAKAIARYELALEHARASGERRREAWSLGLGAWALLNAGRTDEARVWAAQCLALVRDLQWRSFTPWPLAVLAEVALLDDRPAAGSAADLERAFAMSCQLQDPCWEGASGRVLALHHARQGDAEAALQWIVDARKRAVRNSDTWVAMVGVILVTEAELRAACGDGAGADHAARDATALAARTQLDALLPRCLALLRGG
jgi:DNA-binding SARP family transcriptional activator